MIFAWAELDWYRRSGDAARLRKVYPVLLAHHRWNAAHRTWKDGTYFSSGWGSGMDNIPRVDTTRYSAEFHHGFLSWVDVTLQQVFDARNLIAIAKRQVEAFAKVYAETGTIWESYDPERVAPGKLYEGQAADGRELRRPQPDAFGRAQGLRRGEGPQGRHIVRSRAVVRDPGCEVRADE